MGLTVGLVYNLGLQDPPEDGEPPDANAELDSETTVMAVADALRWGGHEVVFVEANESALDILRMHRPDICFNIGEGLRGNSRESQLPAVMEMLGIPYTGSNVLTLALALDKPMAKRVFAYHRVPTPKFEVYEMGEVVRGRAFKFPAFVKPAGEGSSKGISPASLVTNLSELRLQVERIHTQYRQAALVEEFLSGREFTVGILGNHDHHFFPITEINFAPCPAGHPAIYSYQFKKEWEAKEYYFLPAPLSAEERDRLCRVALAAFKALNCYDVARVDMRLDGAGVPNVIEVNPLPGLAPGFSDLPRMADADGMGFNGLINSVLAAGLERYGMSVPRVALRTA
jgi:D-alanine-D-alanine ligase